MALGVSTLLAALTVTYRDLRFLIPFIVQLGMWVSAVVFPIDRILPDFASALIQLFLASIVVGWCGWPFWVIGAKSLLTRKKAAFTEHDVATDSRRRQQMWDRAGAGATFPQIFIGEIHVGGCDELYALDREGKLDSLLAGEKANP